jgi:hypothetical protein
MPESGYWGGDYIGPGSTAGNESTVPSPETQARAAWLESQRQENRAYWDSVQKNADNPFTAVGAAWMRTFGQAGFDIAQGATGLYALATDAGARQQAKEGLINLAEHPGVVVDKAQSWWNDTNSAQKAEDLGRLVFGGLATAGIAKPLESGASFLLRSGEGVGDIGALRFTQTTASPVFSDEGIFAGRRISELAQDLRGGVMAPEQVPVEYIVRDGNPLIVNTRSALALQRADIPQSGWNLIDRTGVPEVETRITERLLKNQLDNTGTSTLRITGQGKYISNLQ